MTPPPPPPGEAGIASPRRALARTHQHTPMRFNMRHPPALTLAQATRLASLEAGLARAIDQSHREGDVAPFRAFEVAHSPELELLRAGAAGVDIDVQEISSQRWADQLSVMQPARHLVLDVENIETFTPREPYSGGLYHRYVRIGRHCYQLVAHQLESLESMVKRISDYEVAKAGVAAQGGAA